MALRRAGGYSLVVLVMIIAVMNIAIAAMLPLWSQEIRREKEEELIFRGLQYAEAIRVFHNRFQRWPTRLEELVEIKPRSIRQLWKDPMTEDGKWQLIFEGRENLPIDVPPPAQGGTGGSGPRQPQSKPAEINRPGAGGLDQQGTSFGPIKGVYSRSTRKSILIWGGRQKYNEWRFNTDLLNVGAQRGPAQVGVPPSLNQPIIPVRWIGRPWRNFGGSNVPVGPEPVLHPGGGPVSTPGSPGVAPPPPPRPSPGGSRSSGQTRF